MTNNNPGQFLSRLFGILTRALAREARPHACARWGCLLPVGKSSTFGLGPTCDVCRYGLRSVSTVWKGDLFRQGPVQDHDFQVQAYLASRLPSDGGQR